jgi:hypothetical protein
MFLPSPPSPEETAHAPESWEHDQSDTSAEGHDLWHARPQEYDIERLVRRPAPRRGKGRWLLVAGGGAALLALFGIGMARWQKGRTSGFLSGSRTISVYGNLASKFDVPVRVIKKGKEPVTLAQVERFQDRMSVELPAGQSVAELGVQVLSPEGWRDCTTTVEHYGATESISFQASRLTLWVDNEGGAAQELRCGKVVLQVPAHSKSSFVLAAHRTQHVAVKLDGREVGALPPAGDQEGYLIDTAGKHNYKFEFVHYRRNANPTPAAPGFGLPAVDPLASSRVRFFFGQHVHKLPSATLDYFLTPAPQNMSVPVQPWQVPSVLPGTSDAVRTELVRLRRTLC